MLEFSEQMKTTPCTMCLNYLTIDAGFAECDFDIFPRSPAHKAEMHTPLQLECPHFEFAYKFKEQES